MGLGIGNLLRLLLVLAKREFIVAVEVFLALHDGPKAGRLPYGRSMRASFGLRCQARMRENTALASARSCMCRSATMPEHSSAIRSVP